MTKEPVAIFAAVQAAIVTFLGFGEAFNVWDLNETQTAAVTGLWVALTAVYGAFVRDRVSPVSSLEERASDV